MAMVVIWKLEEQLPFMRANILTEDVCVSEKSVYGVCEKEM